MVSLNSMGWWFVAGNWLVLRISHFLGFRSCKSSHHPIPRSWVWVKLLGYSPTPLLYQGLIVHVTARLQFLGCAPFSDTPPNDPEQPQKWLVQPSEFRFKDCWNISDQVHSTVPSYRTPPDPLAPFERLPSGPPPSSCQSAHLKVQPLG